MQGAKQFADALNKSLDEIDAPNNIRERSIILSKMLQIPKQQAWSLLEGQVLPDQDILERIANELEFDIAPFSRE